MNALADLPLYHGTDYQFSEFTPSERGLFGMGIYLTTCIEDAELYTSTGQVLEIEGHALRPYYTVADYDAGEEIDFDSPAVPFIRELFGDEADARLAESMAGDGSFGCEVAERLEEMGHDAIVIRWPDGLVHVVALYPSQVRISNCHEFDCSAA